MKILIVRLSAFGDTVQTLPLLYLLKKHYPDAFIGWAVEELSSEILINHPLIDKLYILPKTKRNDQTKAQFLIHRLKSLIHIIKEIRKEKYDIVIDVQELLKSAVIAFLSGAKRKLGHLGSREFSYLLMNELLPPLNFYDNKQTIIYRYLDYARHLDIQDNEIVFPLPLIDPKHKKHCDELLSPRDPQKLTIALCPATTWQTKLWPTENWAELINKLDPTFNIVITGSPKDLPYINTITANVSNPDNLIITAGKTTFLDLIELLKQVDIVIATDTGPMHLAYALEKPIVIAIFGATGKIRSGPPDLNKHTVIATDLHCQPCFDKSCKKNKNHLECLKSITPEDVIQVVIQES